MTNITKLGRVHGRAVAILLLCTLFVSSWSQHIGSPCSFNIIAGEGNITTSDCSRINSCTSQCRWNISSNMSENVISLSFFEDPNQGKTPVEITFEDGCGNVSQREATYYGTALGLLLSYPIRPNISMKMQSKSRCIIVTVHADEGIDDLRGIVVHYKEGKPVEDVFLRVENQSVITAHDHLGLDILESDYVLYGDGEIHIRAMALHPRDKMLYIADGVNNTIRRYEVETFDKPIKYIDSIVTQGLNDVTSLAVDPVSGTVYWTDGELNTISSANYDGTSRRDVITTGLQHPNNIVLDHLQQTLYWTCDGDVFTVQRAFIDGSNHRTVVTQDSGPIIIALEFQQTGSEVHWMNNVTGDFGTISGEQSRSGFWSETFKYTTSFSVFDKYWYWTKADQPYLFITKDDVDWYISLRPFYNMTIMLHYQTPELDSAASRTTIPTIGWANDIPTLPQVTTDTYRLTFHGPSFSFDQKQESGDDNFFVIPVILSILTLLSVSGGLVYLLIWKRSFHTVFNSSGLFRLKLLGTKRGRDEEKDEGEQDSTKPEENGTDTCIPFQRLYDNPH